MPQRWCYVLGIDLFPYEIDEPLIYRRIKVPGAIKFHELHKAITVAFQWIWKEDDYEFRVEPGSISINTKGPDPDCSLKYGDSRKAYLAEIVENRDFDGKLVYIHSEENQYRHEIRMVQKVQKSRDYDTQCFLIFGIGCCMAEGLTLEGWQLLKRIYSRPKETRTEDEKEMTDWYEQECPNGNPLGLEDRTQLQFGAFDPGTPLDFVGAEDGCVIPMDITEPLSAKSGRVQARRNSNDDLPRPV